MTEQITFTVERPDDVSDSEFFEWVRFSLGEIGGLSLNNPMADTELEAEFGSVRVR